MLETILDMLQDWRAANPRKDPRILHINYRYERELRQARDDYSGILPIVSPLTVFGMYIEFEYTYGPWAWISGAPSKVAKGLEL